MTGTKELRFSVDEYATRMRRTREEMTKRGVDVLLVHTAQNIYYLCGHYTFGISTYQCLIVPADADPFLVVRYLESGNARKISWLRDDQIVTYDDEEDPIARTLEALRDRRLAAKRVGLEDDSFYTSSRTAARLRAGLDGAASVDAGGTVERVRRTKSPAEIAYIREACRYTAIGTAAAIETIAPGRTENDVSAAAVSAMIRAGSEFLTIDPIVTSGPYSGIAHMTFQGRRLERGDSVLMEMGGIHKRYVGPLMRSAVIGPPSDEVKRFRDVVLEALAAAIGAIRPGVTSGSVDAACRAPIERAGLFEKFRKRTGYSVGIGFAPGWIEFAVANLKRDDPLVLEPGMVFHIPPALREHERFGVGFSETVAVTANGCEVLSSAPRELAQR